MKHQRISHVFTLWLATAILATCGSDPTSSWETDSLPVEPPCLIGILPAVSVVDGDSGKPICNAVVRAKTGMLECQFVLDTRFGGSCEYQSWQCPEGTYKVTANANGYGEGQSTYHWYANCGPVQYGDGTYHNAPIVLLPIPANNGVDSDVMEDVPEPRDAVPDDS